YARYVGKSFWALSLGLCYRHSSKWLHWWQVGGALLLLLVITVLGALAPRHRYLIVGWLWFLIMLIPMIGLIQVGEQGMADRCAYASFVGLFLMVCYGVA